MTLISLSARTLSAASRIPKIFFGNFARAFFSECSGPAPPLPNSFVRRSAKKEGRKFCRAFFRVCSTGPSCGGGGIFRPPPPPPNSGVNSRGNSGGGIFNGISVPLICPSRRPSAPSAERPAAAPAALRRGFARPGRCFAPGDALRPSPDILRRIHPTPLLGGGRRRPRPPARPRRDGGAGPELPECPGKGAPRPAPHSATGKAFFPPARPHSADSGEFKADALARRARQPVSTSYCTAQHLLLHRPPC